MNDETSTVKLGTLWDEPFPEHLGTVWHRLTSWPDTCPGLKLLRKRLSAVPLSNNYNERTRTLAEHIKMPFTHTKMPFTHTYSSDLLDLYKPKAQISLEVADKSGVNPEERVLVATHFGDLKGAKVCEYCGIYGEIPLEKKSLEPRQENSPDLVIEDDENGFVALARCLGVEKA